MDQTQRPPTQARPRSKSAWSFHSDKSRHSMMGGMAGPEMKESSIEKRKSQMTGATKANPNQAMNEVQPNVAALEASTLSSLSSVQHIDLHGNPITEPDLSNPTRPRWERPLDTIRAFEDRIDIAQRRRSQMRPGTADMSSGYGSRRTSYFGGLDQGYNQNRYSHVGGYYGRPRDSYGARDSYAQRHSYAPRDPILQHGHGPPDAYDDYPPPPPRHRYSQRKQSDPALHRHGPGGLAPQPVYPTPNFQHSRDTVGTGESGSHSEPWTNSTDPSSENSSVDRHPVAKPPPADVGEQYGFNGFGNSPIMEEYDGAGGPSNPYGEMPPRPQVGAPSYYNVGRQQQQHRQHPLQNGGPPKLPLKAGMPPVQQQQQQQQQPLMKSSGNAPPAPKGKLIRGNSEKRTSWFKRRFSKG